MHAGHKVFVGVETNIALIVGNLQNILGQQLRPHLIPLLNIIIILITYQIVVCYLIKLFKQITMPSEGGFKSPVYKSKVLCKNGNESNCTYIGSLGSMTTNRIISIYSCDTQRAKVTTTTVVKVDLHLFVLSCRNIS